MRNKTRNKITSILRLSLLSSVAVCGASPESKVYVPAYSRENASNLKTPIVEKSDPKVSTHRLKIGNITFGFSDKGGGYLNYCDLGDGKNICSPFYGRGWQHAIRDFYHSHRYNPTQAGFRDFEGAPVTVLSSKNKITIPKFNLPLFSDPIYDFVEHEELIEEKEKYIERGKNTDNDGIKENNVTGDDEIRSEWDFSGIFENASSMTPNNIPALRHRFYYAYVRKPASVLQFGEKARLDDGKPVLDKKYKLQDISPLLPGKQTATVDDLSYGQFTFGLRILTRVRDLAIPWWVEKGKLVRATEKYPANSPAWKKGKYKGGRWVVFNDKLPGQKNASGQKVRERLGGKKAEMGLMMLADGTDANKAMAIGLYVPLNSPINRAPFVGIDPKSLKIKYKENRNMQYFFQGGQRVPVQYNLVERVWFTGMLAPTRNVFEAYYHDSFLLFGTPQEIFTAVKHLEKHFAGLK
jgi:hypothetical protein